MSAFIHFNCTSSFQVSSRERGASERVEVEPVIMIGGVVVLRGCVESGLITTCAVLSSVILSEILPLCLLMPLVCLLMRDVFVSCRLPSPGPSFPCSTNGRRATILWLVCMRSLPWEACGMQWLQARVWLLSRGSLRC